MAGTITLHPVDPTRFPDWDERIANHPDATIFHTAAWARVLSTTYGYLPTYFIASERYRLIALLPFMEVRSWITGTRGVSLPFTDECSPILPEGRGWSEAIRPVIEFAESRGWRTLEVRGRGCGMRNIPASAEYLSHVLDLTAGEETLFAGYRANIKRNIRKGEKEGIEVVDDHSPAELREFYRLNCLTRREHGLPPQPLWFFEKLREHLLGKGLGILLLARHRGKAIAGAVFLHFGEKAIYKYGASDRRYQHLRANTLVFHEGIRKLCGKGIRTLFFGRTDLHHEGLRRFKLSWGAVEAPVQYAKYDVRSKSYISLDRHREKAQWGNAFAKLPLPILQIIGRIAYRHVG